METAVENDRKLTKLVVEWSVAVIIMAVVGLAALTAFLTPVLVLSYFVLRIPSKVLFFAVIGRLLSNMRQNLRVGETRKIYDTMRRKPRVMAILFAVIYVDIVLVVIVSSFLLSMTSAAILLPILWYTLESWLMSVNKWYITPAGILTKIFVVIGGGDFREVPSYLPMPLIGRVQRRLT
jgi:hypothetical protein